MSHQDKESKKQREPKDKYSELSHTLFESRWCSVGRQCRDDRAKARPASGFHDQHRAASADGTSSGEQGIGRFRRQCGVAGCIRLERRKRLARHQGFVDLQFPGVEDDSIGRYEIAGTELHDVSGDECGYRYRDVLAIPNDVGTNSDRFPQRLGRQFGAMFLNDVQRKG